MIDLLAVRDALGAAVDTVPGLNGYSHQPASPDFPCAVVAPPDTLEYRRTHRGSGTQFVVTVYVSTAGGLGEADRTLDTFMSGVGAASVPAAIEAVNTPSIEQAVVLRSTNWRETQIRDDSDNVVASLVAADLICTITHTKE